MPSDESAPEFPRLPPDPFQGSTAVTAGDALTVSRGPSDDPTKIGPGTLLGRYVVLEEIGVGGMGVVLRAYDPRLNREVALKRVRSVRDASDEARLLREAHAMARLSHPNVVVVHDVETSAHGVVVAMEYVRGQTLGQWREAADRTWQEIFGVFIEAGNGLVAAHEAGLLHRDFKPANVFVGEDGRVRVGDFGLARAGRPSAAIESLELAGDRGSPTLTRAGVAMGTPRYMAPEQHHARDLDAAADQFAFCVALRESLTGEPPYRARDLLDLVAAKDAGPPRWPNEGKLPEAAIAAIQRGLAPDPAQRWPELRALLEVLHVARSPRAPRRYGLAAAGAGIGILAVVFVVSSTTPCQDGPTHLVASWPARRGEIDRVFASTGLPYAADTAREVQRRLDAYARAWLSGYADACEATHVRGEQSSAQLDRRMKCLRDARLGLEASLEVLATPDGGALEHAVDVAAGLPDLTRCEDPTEEGPPEDGEDARAYAEVTEALARADALRLAANDDMAERVLAEPCASEITRRYPTLALDCALEGGLLRRLADDVTTARDVLTEGFDLALARGDMRRASRIASTLAPLLAGETNDRAGADWVARVARQTAEALEPDARERPLAQHATAMVAMVRGDSEAAIAAERLAIEQLRRIAPDDVAVVAMLVTLGGNLSGAGQLDEARAVTEEAIEVRTAAVGADHPDIAIMLSNLGGVLLKERKLDEAEPMLRRSLAIRRAALPGDHSGVVASLINLASLLNMAGRAPEAEVLLLEALAALDRTDWDAGGRRFEIVSTLGMTRRMRGDPEGAAAYQQQAVELAERVYGARHAKVASALMNLAVAVNERDPAEAAAVLRRAAAIADEAHPDPQITNVHVHANLGRLCHVSGDWSCAEAELSKALQLAHRVLGGEHPDVPELLVTLGDVARETGDLATASDRYARAAAHAALDRTTQANRAQLRAGRARLRWAESPDEAVRAEVLAAHRDVVAADVVENRANLDAWMRDVGIDVP